VEQIANEIGLIQISIGHCEDFSGWHMCLWSMYHAFCWQSRWSSGR